MSGCSPSASSSWAPRSTTTSPTAVRADSAAVRRGPHQGHPPLHQLARRLDQRRHGDLRHHGAGAVRRRDLRDGYGRLDGRVPARRGHQGQALRAAARAHPDAPAARRHHRQRRRHRHSGRAVRGHQEGDVPAERRVHRPDRSSASRPTPTATAGSRPRRPSSTASSTTSSPAPRSTESARMHHDDHPDRSPAAAAGALHPAVVHRALELRRQGVQPVQQAVRGTHHLPRRAGGRRVGQRHHGPAAGAGVAGSRPRHHHVHQLARVARSPR